ncbi:hypothetical protein B0H10DRAFT_1962713 [Mycena sp. CBHHK59/15]|nr:hypothetical protein B0H10DRAFT_1962713 [Mycena sp. CBHHK59/15]
MFPVPDIRSPDAEGEEAKSPDPVPAISGTQMDKRRSGPRSKPTRPVKPPVDERPAGWLWQLGKLTKMTDAEMEEWSSEGDRVQWFRAEAEMKRWQEQGEQKIAELLRSNRSFKHMEATWTTLASTNHLPGHQAYARQKAAMHRRRAEQARGFITLVGYPELLEDKRSTTSLLVVDNVAVVEYARPIRTTQVPLDVRDDLLLGFSLEDCFPHGNAGGADPVAPSIDFVLGLDRVIREDGVPDGDNLDGGGVVPALDTSGVLEQRRREFGPELGADGVGNVCQSHTAATFENVERRGNTIRCFKYIR